MCVNFAYKAILSLCKDNRGRLDSAATVASAAGELASLLPTCFSSSSYFSEATSGEGEGRKEREGTRTRKRERNRNGTQTTKWSGGGVKTFRNHVQESYQKGRANKAEEDTVKKGQ